MLTGTGLNLAAVRKTLHTSQSVPHDGCVFYYLYTGSDRQADRQTDVSVILGLRAAQFAPWFPLASPRLPSLALLASAAFCENQGGRTPVVQSTASYVSAGKQGAHRAARREAPRARAVSRRPQAQLHHSYTSRPQGLGASAVCNQWAGVFGLVAPPASPVCS